MDPHFKAILDEVGLGLGKLKSIASAIEGSPITTTMERLVPGLAGLVGKLATDAAIASGIGSAIPSVEALIAILEDLGMKPLDFSDPSVPGYQDRRDAEEITG